MLVLPLQTSRVVVLNPRFCFEMGQTGCLRDRPHFVCFECVPAADLEEVSSTLFEGDEQFFEECFVAEVTGFMRARGWESRTPLGS